ncbi:MAG: hypothetical protein ABI904_02960 [Chloroflexota bacterium]
MNKEFNNISDSLDGIDKDTNHPAKSPDRFVDQAPVLAGLVHDTPQGAGIAADDSSIEGTIVYEAPLGEVAVYKVPANETISLENMVSVNGASTGLLAHEESENLRKRWSEIQGRFVDEPRAAVQQADALVSDVIEKINQMFTNEHNTLEGQWQQGADVSTEDLRQALQHYRSFFNRLVV